MRALLCGLLLLASISLIAQAPMIQNVPGRTKMSLDGRWQYIIDPYGTGNGDRFFEDKHQENPGQLIEYDFDHSPSMNVPGDWNSQDPALLYYEGIIWFRREFRAEPRPGKRYFLYFGAVNYTTSVYLDGHRIADHEGGFTPFQVEVTGLAEGTHSLVLRVDNTRRADGVPTLSTDWWNYGGITRSVYLIEVPPTFIRDYSIGLDPLHPDRVCGFVQMDGAVASQRLTLRIPGVDLTRHINTDSTGRADFDFREPKLKKWSPEHPTCYEVILKGVEDTVRDKIGFRTISVQGSTLLLNGQPLFLRGICLHDENPFLPGRPRGEADERMLMEWAKSLHCNFVRLAHYPHDESQLRLADQMGMLVWSEIPVYWDIAWDNPATLENAEAQLTDMISRDRNRASVIVWSIGNETPNIPSRLRFMGALADSARVLDSTRLVAAALLIHQQGHDLTVDDSLAEKLDLVSFNEYLGWYSGPVEDISKARFHIPYRKPVLVTEWGAGALGGYHGDSATRWTEEYQAALYREQLRTLTIIPGLCGMTPWILVDFRSPRRMNPTFQNYWNRKGVISSMGQKKQAYFVLQQFYEGIERTGHLP